MKTHPRNSLLTWLKIGSVIASLALSGAASAHNMLKASEPANGAMLETAPKELVLEFNGAVRLVKIAVEQDGEAIDVGFKPSVEAAKRFTLPMQGLGLGATSVRFSLIGEDGHTVAGHVDFAVGTAAVTSSGH